MFALFLLVLVLAAIATLSLSHLTSQKMEMQVASDTAAYSQAVAAARTYNSVALLNRAQVATMVAMQGIHSAVSFAGTYRGAINATMYAYEDDFNSEFGDCTRSRTVINFGTSTSTTSRNVCEIIDTTVVEDSCRRAHPFNFFGISFNFICVGDACPARRDVMGDWGFLALDCSLAGISTGRVPLLKDEWCRVKGVWQALDERTGAQGRLAQGEAVELGEKERVALEDTLPGALQPLAASSISVAGAAIDSSVARNEVERSFAGGGSFNGLEAALGSRAHPFISQRDDGRRAIEEQLRRVIAPSGAAPDEIHLLADFKGSSFFTEPGSFDARYSFNHGMREPHAFASWADEHGRVSVSYAGANRGLRTPGVRDTRHQRTFRGSTSATDLQHRGDTHEWCPVDLNAEAADPADRHTLLPHKMPPANEPDPCENSSCIWPGFYDINATVITDRGDAYGQPKLLDVATKDLAGQKNPWNLFFRFRFAQSGAGAQTDLTSKHAVAGVVPDFQALSAGMAYYHRPGHWKEHPNLFNPYWRATLVRANIDSSWQADLGSVLSPANKAALDALGRSYQGIP